jgi:hypothetical protein
MLNIFKALDVKELKEDLRRYGSIMPFYIKAQMVSAVEEKELKIKLRDHSV